MKFLYIEEDKEGYICYLDSQINIAVKYLDQFEHEYYDFSLRSEYKEFLTNKNEVKVMTLYFNDKTEVDYKYGVDIS